MKKFNFGIFLFLAIFILNCGPEQTSQEKAQSLEDDRINTLEKQLTPIVGTFAGIYTKNNGFQTGAILAIDKITISAANVGNNSVSKIITLKGILQTCIEDQPFCLKEKFQRLDQLASYDSGDFKNGILSLNTNYTLQARLTATVSADNSHIQGVVTSDKNRKAGTLDLVRISK